MDKQHSSHPSVYKEMPVLPPDTAHREASEDVEFTAF